MKSAMFFVTVFAASVVGCASPETLVFDDPEACEAKPYPTEESACYYPSGCCDLGLRGLAAVCEEYYPTHFIPIMCDAIPEGKKCQKVPLVDFECSRGDVGLLCCSPD